MDDDSARAQDVEYKVLDPDVGECPYCGGTMRRIEARAGVLKPLRYKQCGGCGHTQPEFAVWLS
jgi:predicted nucleic acid-binding Zn ribbon protein